MDLIVILFVFLAQSPRIQNYNMLLSIYLRLGLERTWSALRTFGSKNFQEMVEFYLFVVAFWKS